jgi:hypothetical protein
MVCNVHTQAQCTYTRETISFALLSFPLFHIAFSHIHGDLSVLYIHSITIIRGLDLVLHEEGISKKEAAENRKKCCEPGPGTSLALPTVKSKAKDFDDYNESVLEIFTEHSEQCLYCRTRNYEAIENAQHAAQLAEEIKLVDEEEEERHRRCEDERHRLEEERLQHALEEEEAHRRAEEEEEAHRLAEEEAKRKHDAEVAALEEATRLRILEVEEEADRRHAEIERSLHSLKEKRDRALATATLAAEDVARRHEIEKVHLQEEERLREEKKKNKEKRSRRKSEEDEDRMMMRVLREEEQQRRAVAENAAREKRLASLGHHKFLRKHDGVLAASQSNLVYQDKKSDDRAIDDIAHMSLAHAKHEHLIHEHHMVGGKSFHDSHTFKPEEFDFDEK